MFKETHNYTGAVLAVTGQAMRDQLVASYGRANTALAYVELDGAAYSVRFDHLTLQVRDPRTQLQGTGYHAVVTLLEALAAAAECCMSLCLPPRGSG